MSGRSMRARAPVNYNDKDSMEPAWLKKLHTTASSTPPKMREKAGSSKTASSSDSADKENTAKQMNKSKEQKSSKLQTTAKTKTKDPAEKAEKSIKHAKKEKKMVAAARGRNAGVTVVPIGGYSFECFVLIAF